MANPRPTPKPENLRPPWPSGTSGNPAGYSRGRRISDAIERLIEEMALDREFGATAIAMLGARSDRFRIFSAQAKGAFQCHEISPRVRFALEQTANRADRLGMRSGPEWPRIGTSSARVASVWCFAW